MSSFVTVPNGSSDPAVLGVNGLPVATGVSPIAVATSINYTGQTITSADGIVTVLTTPITVAAGSRIKLDGWIYLANTGGVATNAIMRAYQNAVLQGFSAQYFSISARGTIPMSTIIAAVGVAGVVSCTLTVALETAGCTLVVVGSELIATEVLP